MKYIIKNQVGEFLGCVDASDETEALKRAVQDYGMADAASAEEIESGKGAF